MVNTIDKRDSLTVSYTLANMSSDNTNNNMMPLYSVRGSGPYYRNMQSHPYERLDAKPTYGTVWLAPCEEDTSPTENYSFDQSASYMPTPPQPAGSNTYSLPYRSTQPTVRTHTAAANYYSDYGQPYTTNGLPYLQTDRFTVRRSHWTDLPAEHVFFAVGSTRWASTATTTAHRSSPHAT